MYVKDRDLHLYSVTLQKKSNYISSCIGHFISIENYDEDNNNINNDNKHTSRDPLQVVIATESQIELYDISNSRFELLCELPIFSRITAIHGMKSGGNNGNDLLVLLSDSGYISINEFYYRKDGFKQVALRNIVLEPLYRSGLRRFSPIYSVQTDPLNRCIILNSQERTRIAYTLSFKNDAESITLSKNKNGKSTSVTLSAPIELATPDNLIIDTCVLNDSSKEPSNPLIAAIEYDYVTESQNLKFYQLDLNLQYFVALSNVGNISHSQNNRELKNNEHFIMALPSLEQYGITAHPSIDHNKVHGFNSYFIINGDDGYIRLLDLNGTLQIDDCKIKIPTPLTSSDVKPPTEENTNLKIVSGKIQKLKKSFFVLLQANNGDLFKLVVSSGDTNNNNKDKINNNFPNLEISYFESIPISSDFHIFKNGLLMNIPDFKIPTLYQFESLGNSSDHKFTYKQHVELTNLSEVSTLSTRLKHPILKNAVILNNTPLNLKFSTNDILSFGVQFDELIITNLQQSTKSTPEQIWSINENKLIVLSFSNKTTTFLNIQNESIDELKNTTENETGDFFVTHTDKTIYFCEMYNFNTIQVTQNYFIHFRHNDNFSKIKQVLKWLPPAGVKIITATHSKTQLCVALSNNEIVYFELDDTNTSLNEFQDHLEEIHDHYNEISQIALTNDEMNSQFLLVSTKSDHLLKLYSLKKNDTFMDALAIQVVPDTVVSLIYLESLNECHVGLQNGIYVTSKVNLIESTFYDIRSKYIGTRPVRLSNLKYFDTNHIHDVSDESDEDDESDDDDDAGENASEENSSNSLKNKFGYKNVIGLHSNKTWVSFWNTNSQLCIRPVQISNKHAISDMVPFSTHEININGVCSITKKGNMIIGKLLNLQENQIISQQTDDDDNENENDEADDHSSLLNFQHMYVQETERLHHEILYSDSKFCIKSTAFKTDWYQHRIITAQFLKISNLRYLFVSTHENKILTFQITHSPGTENQTCTLLHATDIGEKVHVMQSFREKLLLPIKNVVVLYSVGKSQILKKSFSFLPPTVTKVVSIDVYQDFKIAIADVKQSVTICCFHEPANQFLTIADDIVKRYSICVKFLDEKTVLISDKFGGVSTLRIPDEADDIELFVIKNYPNIANSVTSYEPSNDTMLNIMDCPLKLSLQNHTFYNDIITSWHIVEMCNMSDRPVVIGTGIQGSVIALVPLLTKKEVQVLSKLEETLRLFDIKHCNFALNYCGRDHLLYTSILGPERNIIDGDYCELFYTLTPSQQDVVATMFNEGNVIGMESAPSEFQKIDIIKMLNGIRTSCV